MTVIEMPESHEHLRAEAWGSDMDRYVLKYPVMEIDDVLVDVDAFFETHSTCEMCSSCCNMGTTIPKETAEKLQPILDEIKEKYIPKNRWKAVGWHYSNDYKMNITNVVEVDKGRTACSFLYQKGDRLLCAIYSWALETGRPAFEYLPFECVMYPIALLPYEGLLYPNKTLLTLRLPQNWHLIDFYGDRPANRSVYGIWRRAIRNRIKRKLRFLMFFKPQKENSNKLEPHFCERDSWLKPLSYKYYSPQLNWYFGEDFYKQLCQKADDYYEIRNAQQDQSPQN